ncbi:MAG: AAA family ATPase [Anaerolineales bacterium]|nr:AAA family ATPase [Anaerolineales bacterium]
MQNLQLHLLGKPEVYLNGRPLTEFETSKAQALLYYLAVTGRAHSRDTLADLLWGDMDEATAKRNLSKALSNLRHLLEPYLLIDRQSIAFNQEKPYELDVAIFQAAIEGSSLLEPSKPEDLSPLRKAVNLYGGDFLEGFYIREALAFEEWLTSQREQLREMMLQGLDLLVRGYTDQQSDDAAGLEYASRLLALDPWRESAHRHMMLLLARAGQRSAALAQYETCRRILAEELGVEPLAETTALYQRLKAAAPPPHNLPPPPNSFVGRTAELKQVELHLHNPACRLLTLVGPGGIGKTSLALEAARRCTRPEPALSEAGFADGVYFVNLAPVGVGTDRPGEPNPADLADLFASAIAEALNFTFQGPTNLMSQLLKHLRQKQVLLVLDNFEHLMAGATLLIDLWQKAPGVKLLVTSRERLNLREEWVVEVEGLEYPREEKKSGKVEEWMLNRDSVSTFPLSNLPAFHTSSQYSAVALFIQRAQQVRDGFALTEAEAPHVIQICQLVEGAPLALELAASWLRALTCAEIAQEIERGLDFLTTSLRDVPERHRSMRAVFEQSWRLLSEAEQTVLRRLSVFRGGFRRAAAQEVAGGSLLILTGLVDKSLLRLTDSGRYQSHELLRQFAAEKLAEAPLELESTLNAHCRYYGDFLHRHEDQLEIEEGAAKLSELLPEADNIRAGWERAITADWPLAIPAMVQYVRAMRLFYSACGWYHEGIALFDKAIHRLETVGAESNDVQRRVVYGRLLLQQAMLCQYLSRFAEAEALCSRSLDALQGTGADRDEAATLRRLGALNYVGEKYDLAPAYLVKSLALLDPAKSPVSYAKTQLFLGMVAHEFKQYQQAEQLLGESIATLKSFGELRYRHFGLGYLAGTMYALGHPVEAKRLMGECLSQRELIGDPRTIPHMLYHIRGISGLMDAALGHEARRMLQTIIAICRENADDWGVTLSLSQLGYTFCRLGEYDEAERCFRETLQSAMKQPILPMALEALVGLTLLLTKPGPPSPENQEWTFTSLALVLNHPATTRPTYDRAATLLAELEETGLPPEVVAAAHERAQALTLEALVEEILSTS